MFPGKNVFLSAFSESLFSWYSSFATELGQKGGDLGEGQEYWRGFSQSQFGLSLNINVSARAIYEPIMEKKPLKGVEVPLSYEEHTGYEITGVSVEPQSKLKFTHERYNIGLRDVAMPALLSGRDSKPAYLPMEVPVQMVKHNGHNKDELIQREFGMTIREDMTMLVFCGRLW
ncbi:hypothetical protein ACFX11_031306 [Malus domestica]